jgi:hypothetical protein
MAERFGWTFDYIDSLPLEKYDEFEKYLRVMDGLRKGSAFLARQQQK